MDAHVVKRRFNSQWCSATLCVMQKAHLPCRQVRSNLANYSPAAEAKLDISSIFCISAGTASMILPTSTL